MGPETGLRMDHNVFRSRRWSTSQHTLYGQFIKCGHPFLVPHSELSAARGDGDGGDLSAEFQGVSLNKELLLGQDLINGLVGVLICFIQDKIAVVCDIELVFHSFYVDPKHQCFR